MVATASFADGSIETGSFSCRYDTAVYGASRFGPTEVIAGMLMAGRKVLGLAVEGGMEGLWIHSDTELGGSGRSTNLLLGNL